MLIQEIENFDLLSLHKISTKKYPVILESTSKNNTLKQFSILFAFPQKIISATTPEQEKNLLKKLDTFLSKINSNNDKNIPFSGGWFVYLSYELANLWNPKPTNLTKSKHPTMVAINCPCAVIKNHTTNKTIFIDEENSELRYKLFLKDLNKSHNQKPTNKTINAKFQQEDESVFIKGVDSSIDYIIKGDVFQVNLSRKWTSTTQENIYAHDIYEKLRVSNPAPFSALATLPCFDIISSSPERLFKIQENIINTRPIAGTAKRSTDNKEDENIKKSLLQDKKNLAEHTMLIDLERNDLGKICIPNSIKVTELAILESYQFVHHIVSNIQGKLKSSLKFSTILEAIFPGGSITGCPKIRCMQIISEIEKKPRDAYTGSIGYISNNGNMDFNILIRTIIKEKENLTIQTGSGIVYDSNSIQELEETKHKAKGILQAFV